MKFTITVGLDDKKPVDRVLEFELGPEALDDLKQKSQSDPGMAHVMLKSVIEDVITDGITEVVGELVGVIPPLDDLTPSD